MKRLNLPLDEFNPHQSTLYGTSNARAKYLIREGHASWICNAYDVVIIGDTVPHGRALLQSLLLDPSDPLRCNSILVVELTNRFDWEVGYRETREYYRMIRKVIQKSENGDLKGKVFWIANNKVEQPFLEYMVGTPVRQGVSLLRPLGVSGDYEYPSHLPEPSKSNYFAKDHFNTKAYQILKDIVPLTLIPNLQVYGGAKNLKRFKGFIDVPYQYSVMKFHENLAEGVTQLVPTPQFLEKLIQASVF
ncbi:UNVERIFIED_CONTAM: hypothetical protein HDU68_002134 [Siphonaria sp. JEL0065]|nr:hypothetical protein HDU68_002134 [Siphonaria sp. JEL0065]